jgi:hypothetical protein
VPLLKDLIHIPERVHQGDFVLKLSEGVTHADQTLRDYVVTPQLVAPRGAICTSAPQPSTRLRRLVETAVSQPNSAAEWPRYFSTDNRSFMAAASNCCTSSSEYRYGLARVDRWGQQAQGRDLRQEIAGMAVAREASNSTQAPRPLRRLHGGRLLRPLHRQRRVMCDAPRVSRKSMNRGSCRPASCSL